MRSPPLLCTISSLNCNSLVKTGSHHQQSSYLRHLRSLQPTIYTFQETHISPSTQINIERLLHPISSLWTRHCGIISYSPDYNITLIDTHSHDRSILCQVSHPNDFYEPFYLLTLYAPADIETERRSFFDGILAWLTNLSSSGTIDLHRLVITGDFNYSLQRSHLSRTTSSAWLGFLDQHFTNAMLVNDCHLVPTYHGPQQRISTIDYIYAGTALSSSARDSQVYTLRPDWSDHNILTTTFMLGHTKTGPGLWRANPAFVQSTSYQEQLTQLIHKYTNDPHHTSLPPAEQWDTLKDAIKQMTRRFGTKHVDWRTATLKFYQRKRHRLLLSQSTPALRQRLLPPIDQVIHTLQQELSDISALRSGITWREKGETSAGFLKRLHQQRQQQQYIHSLSPHADGSSASTNIDTQLLISHQFYQSLYSASPVSDGDIDRYLADTCFKQRLSPADQHLLTAPITIDELQEQASRMVQASSPGDDGFGYPHISLWFSNTSLAKLAVLIYNQALTNGITPASWKSIRLRLLPKKGNLATLKNWRPISLINCDGKIFTRIITRRLAPLLSKIINPLQTGFLPRRFIAENGLALQLIMEQARHFSQDGIGLLLDQEKAYDRIHPRYLQKTMAAMGFPSTLTHSIMTLFFNNRIFVNVNGHFTSAIDQQRGLRQGDPLSPLLFNVAIEPFLLAIQHDHHLQGFTFSPPSHPARSTPSPLKCLAYADDVCVFLHNSEDLDRLQHHMHQYSTLSNAKFNHHKTEAFSLNGRCDDRWSRLLLHHSITTYHHRDSPAPFRYLGFSIGYTKDHQQQVLSTLLANVRKQVGIYSTRNLSIKGKVTVLHSLILSKIWYCLRILVAPQSFFKTLAGICRAFVNSKKPLISYTQMCQPHCQGGLGLMDPQKQQLGMQFRWLNILLQPQQYPSFLGPILLHHLHIAQDPMDSPFLPLLWPTLRRGTLLDSRHSASLWFAAFDSIPLPVNISKASLATCLTIPLLHLCQGVPQDYWLTSAPHRRQPASLCLRYDPDNNRLCVKRGTELTSFPTLTRRFLQDIYHQRIAWVPAITTFLTASSIDYGVVDYSPIIKAWVEDPFWQTFQVRAYRFLYSSMSTTTVKFSKSSIQLFWSAPMQPQARTVWYKILINKAPLQAFLAMIHPPQSTMCMLCGQMEDVRHFIYHCSQKKTVWDQVLSLYFPWISDMSPFVLSLQSLPLVPLTPHLYTICGYIIYGIWQAHWQWIMHQIPFDPIATADHIIIQLHSHLSPSLD